MAVCLADMKPETDSLTFVARGTRIERGAEEKENHRKAEEVSLFQNRPFCPHTRLPSFPAA